MGQRGDGISNETVVPTHWSDRRKHQVRRRNCHSLEMEARSCPMGMCFLLVRKMQKVCAAVCSVSIAQMESEGGLALSIMPRRCQLTRRILTAAPTPVANGDRVVVWHSSGGLHCYDFEGKRIWSRDLGEFEHMWGYGSSPILHGDSILLNCGPGNRTFLTSIDLNTGDTLWEKDEPFEGTGDRNQEGKYMGSWCTPVVAAVDGRNQVICAMPTRIKAHDLASGELAWTFDGVRGPKGDLAYSSPMISGDRCVYVAGFSGPAMAFTTRVERETLLPRISCGETKRTCKTSERAFSLATTSFDSNARRSFVDCVHAMTGEVTWTGPPGKSSWSSIIVANDNLFLTDQEGTTTVFKAKSKCLRIGPPRIGLMSQLIQRWRFQTERYSFAHLNISIASQPSKPYRANLREHRRDFRAP